MLPVNVVRQTQPRAIKCSRQTRILIDDRAERVEARACKDILEILRLPADTLDQTGCKSHGRSNVILGRPSKTIYALLPAVLLGEIAWARPVRSDRVSTDS